MEFKIYNISLFEYYMIRFVWLRSQYTAVTNETINLNHAFFE